LHQQLGYFPTLPGREVLVALGWAQSPNQRQTPLSSICQQICQACCCCCCCGSEVASSFASSDLHSIVPRADLAHTYAAVAAVGTGYACAVAPACSAYSFSRHLSGKQAFGRRPYSPPAVHVVAGTDCKTPGERYMDLPSQTARSSGVRSRQFAPTSAVEAADFHCEFRKFLCRS